MMDRAGAGRQTKDARRTKDAARKHYNPAGLGFPTHRLATSVMSARLTLVLGLALLALRLPSLVQPMGADQSLYAYVGERVRAGGLPYRDAWDQKPPAIHFLYAGLRTVWADDAVVPAADLAAAAAIAVLLYRLGGLTGPAGTGAAAALVFLLLSNPAFTRVGGIRLRSQCETFIALAVTAAMVLLLRKVKRPRPATMIGAGRALRPGLCPQVQRRLSSRSPASSHCGCTVVLPAAISSG